MKNHHTKCIYEHFFGLTFVLIKLVLMVTCYLEYTIEVSKIKEFENYAEMWIPLVNRFGGNHHGYFLPHEGANNKAYALFSFPSLATYEKYRVDSQSDSDCIKAYEYAEKTRCIQSYVRSFLKPVLNLKIEP